MPLDALLVATKLMFTGIELFVPSKSDAHLIRVVAPNGRAPNDGEQSDGIEPHLTYIMFPFETLQKCERCRKEDFTVFSNGKQYGVVIIESETLSLSGNFSHKKLKFDPPANINSPTPVNANKTSLHWMFDCCHTQDGTPLQVDPAVLRHNPDRRRVGLRMDLYYGRFGVDVISPNFSFAVKKISDTTLQCQSLATAVAVTMQKRNDDDVPELNIASRLMNGLALPTLRLKGRNPDDDLTVLVGNEMLTDLKASVYLLSGAMEGHGPYDGVIKPHMKLMRRLFLVKDGDEIFTPLRVEATKCSSDGVFTLHPANPEENGGMSGGCSPGRAAAADPKP